MNTEIEHLSDNKIRMTVTISEAEFETSIDKAFKTLAKQVRLPGFRPGKAPRQILEKQIGYEAGRAQALNDYLSQYYVDALDENDVDPVDYPELKVLSGEEEGDVVFEATVPVRPVVTVQGYKELRVEVEVEEISDDVADRQLKLLQDRHASLEDSADPIAEGDFATIDLSGSIDGEEVAGLTANDYLYEVGSGLIGEELDKQIIGKETDSEFEFTDELSENFGENAGNNVDFKVKVKNIQKKVLPEATDAWIKENTEFQTLEDYKKDALSRMEKLRTLQAQMQVQQKVMEALAETVQEEIGDEFIERETQARLESIAQQSGANMAQLQEYISSLDEDAQNEFNEGVRKDAQTAIKSDLALRAIILEEKLEATDEELEEELQKYAQSSGEKISKIRNRIAKPGVEKQVRLDIARSKAVKLVNETAIAVDSKGNEIPLQIEGQEGDELSAIGEALAHDHDHDHNHNHDHDHDHE